MSILGNQENMGPNPLEVTTIGQAPTGIGVNVTVAQCSVYTFPDNNIRSPENKGHLRSVSHGGCTTFGGSSSGGGSGNTSASANVIGRPSALKGGRGHQRAFSQGQISETHGSGVGIRPTHSRVGSKTDFILPATHKEDISGGTVQKLSIQKSSHNRQPSRSESVYTLRRGSPSNLWSRMILLFSRKKSQSILLDTNLRVVVPNHLVPQKTPKHEHPNGDRPSNKIRTRKYTFLSFLPRNLLEQFHRVANLYFIFIVLLNWFPDINAFGKEIAMIPVLFVLGVTAVKDLFEDRRRYKSDKRINNSTARRYNSEIGRYQKCKWQEITVGDIIYLSNNEVVPADILLLNTSDPGGLCYIDTGHLDGETNLKQRQVPLGVIDGSTDFHPSKFRSRIEVEAPTTKIYRFYGTIIHPNGIRIPVGTENLLLRECIIKNTDFVEGIVVYAGPESKAMLNNGGPRYKRSTLEIQMNKDVIWSVILLLVLCTGAAIGCKVNLSMFSRYGEPFRQNLPESAEAFLSFWTFIILLQIMIPLSLYVTIEMSKLVQIYHIHQNLDLYDPLYDKRIECRAMNITEELGQIQYIFSDKTGTLTENRMIFRRCVIAGVDYSHPKLVDEKSGTLNVYPNPQLESDLYLDKTNETASIHLVTTREQLSEKISEFLYLLALCNTVVISTEHRDTLCSSGTPVISTTTQQAAIKEQNSVIDYYSRLDESNSTTPERSRKFPSLSYEAESPDELALVNAASIYNYKLIKRTPTLVSIFNGQHTDELQVLHILPFDSVRKRMSIIVRDPKTDKITIYCKGADTSMFPQFSMRLDSNSSTIMAKTNTLVNEYAKEGLRVLVMGKRNITKLEYEAWCSQYREIIKDHINNDKREKRLIELYELFESDLSLVGATGIEDRLQEGVPETLSSLRLAGIVLWVLTGDKPETAINIAYSSKLFSQDMSLFKIMTSSKEAAEGTIKFYLKEIQEEKKLLREVGRASSSRENRLKERAVVIDGRTLTFVLDRKTNLTKPFLKLTTYCSSVLCCRATPLQKAFIVKVVKEELHMRTLAIGDGANDVSMIQTADVGIGLSGQEGMQAVMASDFALPRFKYLAPLLLVHGHWNYDRLARMVLYFFYKNTAFVLLVFWFQFYCGFSGGVMVDQVILLLYNLIFTSLPPIALGIYDRVAPAELLKNEPMLYTSNRLGQTYKKNSFFLTIIDATYQSLTIFYVTYFAYKDSDVSLYELGIVQTSACIVALILLSAMDFRSWTIIHVGSIVVSVLSFYLYGFFFNSFFYYAFGLHDSYGIIQHVSGEAIYWFTITLAAVTAVGPRLIYIVLRNTLKPNIVLQRLTSYRRQHRQLRRGEGFLVSWSRSTSTSSVTRTERPNNNGLTAVG